MKEIWKDIEGYPDYMVSNMGNVRGKRGVLKPYIHKRYLRITLYLNGKGSSYFIHKIVAKTFLPNPDNKQEVDHIDTNSLNNVVSNLKWVSHKENMNNPLTRKKQSTRLKGKIGHNTPASKIIAQLDKNSKLLKVWLCAMDAVRQEGYTQEHISSCCKGTLKTHKGYKWQYIDDYLSDWLEQEIQI